MDNSVMVMFLGPSIRCKARILFFAFIRHCFSRFVQKFLVCDGARSLSMGTESGILLCSGDIIYIWASLYTFVKN